METPLDKKRKTYLDFFEHGARDAMLKATKDNMHKSSAYYNRGFKFGTQLFKEAKEQSIKMPLALVFDCADWYEKNITLAVIIHNLHQLVREFKPK